VQEATAVNLSPYKLAQPLTHFSTLKSHHDNLPYVTLAPALRHGQPSHFAA
jgi:hypothetical protein